MNPLKIVIGFVPLALFTVLFAVAPRAAAGHGRSLVGAA